MTRGLERWYGGHDLHFITCSCYRRRPELGIGERRDLFLRVLERARQKYRFVVVGYVVMPEWGTRLKITYSASQTHSFETHE